MSSWDYAPYVPVAQRRANAAKLVAKLAKSGKPVSPVVIEGRRIASSFWGKAWCDNLERYSDFSSRLPRGRTYVRNGSVIDLLITGGIVEALVSGSEIYTVRIEIAAAPEERWRAICGDCTGSVGSVVELLQGALSKNVMERVCREGDGLFPAPKDITMSCTCLDWATMCKHVAAVLYGIGARFDSDPEALFVLREVDRNDFFAIGVDPTITDRPTDTERIIEGDDLEALFGFELDDVGALSQEAVGNTKTSMGKKARPKSNKSCSSVTKQAGSTAGSSRERKSETAGNRRSRAQQPVPSENVDLTPHRPGRSSQRVYAPAVPVSTSVHPDYIISLIDGREFKLLKRHLAQHGLTPEAYRERYGLPPDYPMVAPNYSAARRALAQQVGLGHRVPTARKTKISTKKVARHNRPRKG